MVAVGVMRGATFCVQSLSHPPAESREVTLRALREVEVLGVGVGSEVGVVAQCERRRSACCTRRSCAARIWW